MCGETSELHYEELGYLKTSGIARIKAKLKLNAYYPVYMHAHAQHILPTTLTPLPHVPTFTSTLNSSVHSLMHRSVSLLLLLNIALLCRYTPISCLDSGRCGRNRHRLMTTILHFLAVDTRRRTRFVDAGAYLVASLNVYVFDVEGVDVAGKVAENCEEQVDEEVGAASRYEEDSDRWNCRFVNKGFAHEMDRGRAY